MPSSVQLGAGVGVLIFVGIGVAVGRPTRHPVDEVKCEPSRLDAIASVKRDGYVPGEKVTFSATARNASSSPCSYTSSDFVYTIRNVSGTSLGGGASTGDRWSTEPLILAPGRSLTEAGEWDQRDCLSGPDRCARAATGNYVIDVAWTFDGARLEAQASFRLFDPP